MTQEVWLPAGAFELCGVTPGMIPPTSSTGPTLRKARNCLIQSCGERGFKGLVMTGWFAGNDRAAQMAAGNDLLMPGNPARTKAIIAAVENGTLSRRQLDENVERVLNIIFRSPTFKHLQYSSQPEIRAALLSSNRIYFLSCFAV